MDPKQSFAPSRKSVNYIPGARGAGEPGSKATVSSCRYFVGAGSVLRLLFRDEELVRGGVLILWDGSESAEFSEPNLNVAFLG